MYETKLKAIEAYLSDLFSDTCDLKTEYSWEPVITNDTFIDLVALNKAFPSEERKQMLYFTVQAIMAKTLKKLCAKFAVYIVEPDLTDIVNDATIKCLEYLETNNIKSSIFGYAYWTVSNLLRKRKKEFDKELKTHSIDMLDIGSDEYGNKIVIYYKE